MKKLIEVTTSKGTRSGLIMVIFELDNCNRIMVYMKGAKISEENVRDRQLFDRLQAIEEELRRQLKADMEEALGSKELIHQLKELGFE